VSLENIDIAKTQYQVGKTAFERGDYRQSVQHLEKASALVERHTRLGGEIRIWLVTAYEAAGQRHEAIALCQQLKRHPDWNTRKQGRRILYILEAPQLIRRSEWLTQIPDLSNLDEHETPNFQTQASTVKRPPQQKKQRFMPEQVDLSQVNSQENQFIWIALSAAVLTLGGLFWLG
jgi:tetratricopeptide (TPR) repeat protein